MDESEDYLLPLRPLKRLRITPPPPPPPRSPSSYHVYQSPHLMAEIARNLTTIEEISNLIDSDPTERLEHISKEWKIWETLVKIVPCEGCRWNHPSQKYHMSEGGCLVSDDEGSVETHYYFPFAS